MGNKGVKHRCVHVLNSYSPIVLLLDIHIFHLRPVSFGSTAWRGWSFFQAHCHSTNMLARAKEPCVIECVNTSDLSHRRKSTSVGRHFNLPWYSGLVDVEIFVLQFGTNDQDSEASLTLRLSLVQMWIHRLRATAPLGLNVFD